MSLAGYSLCYLVARIYALESYYDHYYLLQLMSSSGELSVFSSAPLAVLCDGQRGRDLFCEFCFQVADLGWGCLLLFVVWWPRASCGRNRLKTKKMPDVRVLRRTYVYDGGLFAPAAVAPCIQVPI